MGLNVIVCDDSKFARNQLIRVIPRSLITNLYQATNGKEAMQLMREGKGELLFLDLTMPEMDGFQVLEAIKQENIDIMKIVVSGDIQQQAAEIVHSYNVLGFIKKPMNADELREILLSFGLCDENDTENYVLEPETKPKTIQEQQACQFDELKEKFNIATGQAASKIADVLNLFITMPVPKILLRKGSFISAELNSWLEIEENVAISQGFVGNGIHGECIIYFSMEDINNYTHLICDPNASKEEKISQTLELAGLMSGTLIRGFAEQINASINLTHPAVIAKVKNNLTSEQLIDSDILTVELIYDIKDLNVQIKFNVLFTHEAILQLKEILTFV